GSTRNVGAGKRTYSPRVSSVTLASDLILSCAHEGEASEGEASGPAVLLLPGPTDSWRSYQPVLDLLPDEIHAISVSQRGHGESDKPAAEYAVEDFAADVVLLFDALAIDRAFLTGHSGSCFAARRVALDHPDRVAGLILEPSPTTLRDHPELISFADSVLSDLDDPISPDFVRSFVTGTSSERIPPELVDLLVDEALKVPAHVWKDTFSGLLRYDDTTELGRIEAPTLLLWGNADALVPRHMQTHLVRAIPDADLRVYHGLGHTPRWEDTARVSNDLVAFVRRVARTR